MNKWILTGSIIVVFLIVISTFSSVIANNVINYNLEKNNYKENDTVEKNTKKENRNDNDEDFNCLIFGWSTNTFFSTDGTMIAFGYVRFWHEGGTYYRPAKGRIFSIGENGIKQWAGEFYGQISTALIWTPLFADRLHTGVKGFNGAKIEGGLYSRFIGHADHIFLGENVNNN